MTSPVHIARASADKMAELRASRTTRSSDICSAPLSPAQLEARRFCENSCEEQGFVDLATLRANWTQFQERLARARAA